MRGLREAVCADRRDLLADERNRFPDHCVQDDPIGGVSERALTEPPEVTAGREGLSLQNFMFLYYFYFYKCFD